LGFEQSRQSGLDWTPQSQFCEVFINQVYQGTYQATQKVEESSKRVAVSNDGYLLEIEPSGEVDRDHLNFKTPRMTVMIKDPDDLEKNGERFFIIKDYFEQVESILYQENSPDRFEQLKAYLDLESFIDWYLINEIAKNSDAGILHSFF
jgi:spore coat protein CotH